MQNIILLFLAFISTEKPLYSNQEAITNSKTVTILFIGNSLTFTNNLPKLVEEYAKQKGIKMNTKMIAFPNYAIEDHWNDGRVQKLISSEKYDFVILQQGPSSQSNGRRMLIQYGKKYNNLCKLHQTKLCYLMVWPSLHHYHTFDNVIKNYRDAAAVNKSILLPVGKVWKDYIDFSGDVKYYSPDGFHPSIVGSQITAKTITEYLLQQ